MVIFVFANIQNSELFLEKCLIIPITDLEKALGLHLTD